MSSAWTDTPGMTYLCDMRHARPDDLLPIAPLLDELRRIPGLVERTPGSLYRKGCRA